MGYVGSAHSTVRSAIRQGFGPAPRTGGQARAHRALWQARRHGIPLTFRSHLLCLDAERIRMTKVPSGTRQNRFIQPAAADRLRCTATILKFHSLGCRTTAKAARFSGCSSFLQDVSSDEDNASVQHLECERCARRNVEHTMPSEGTTVIDSHDDASSRLRISYANTRSEW